MIHFDHVTYFFSARKLVRSLLSFYITMILSACLIVDELDHMIAVSGYKIYIPFVIALEI